MIEQVLIERMRRKLGREPTVRELDAEIAKLTQPNKPAPLPYVCHCGRPDCEYGE